LVQQKSKLNRRNFLAYASVWLGSCSTLSCGTLPQSKNLVVAFSPESFEIKSYTLRVSNLSGLRILLLTDLHFGHFAKEDLLHSLSKTLPHLIRSCDIILLAGDYYYLENGPEKSPQLVEKIKSLFEAFLFFLKDFSKPVIGVLGNHDRKLYFMNHAESFSKAGAKLLVNETIEVNQVKIWGSDDYLTGFPQELRSSVDLVLTHSPDYYCFYLKNAPHLFKACLAGHTHGGQIKLPFMQPFLLNIGCTQYLEGLFFEPPNYLLVSKGIGFVGLPIRLYCPPELSVVTFQ
jgi:predicted MPP superfamily phosphohydrolase